jgi:hypothetical protein
MQKIPDDIFGFNELIAVTVVLGALWAAKPNIMKAQFKHWLENTEKN